MKMTLKEQLGKNASQAFEYKSVTPTSLARKTSINQTTINRMVRSRDQDPDPRIGTVEAVCEALKIAPWKLLYTTPLPGDVLDSKSLDLFIDNLCKLDKEQRQRIIASATDLIKLEILNKSDT